MLGVMKTQKWVSLIPFLEFQWEVFRSSGPGGQNVNRTNSGVALRWSPLRTSAAFSDSQKERLSQNLGPRLTVAGDLLVRSDVHRDQDMNKKACLEKLEALLSKAMFVPKARKVTRPTRSSVRKRVESKRKISEVKSGRKKIGNWDD